MKVSLENMPRNIKATIRGDLTELIGPGPNRSIYCVGQHFANQPSLIDEFIPTLAKNKNCAHLMAKTSPQILTHLLGNGVKTFGIWCETPDAILKALPVECSVFLYGGTMHRERLKLLKPATFHVTSYTDVRTIKAIPEDKFIFPIGSDKDIDRYDALFSNEQTEFNIIIGSTTSTKIIKHLSLDPRTTFHPTRCASQKEIQAINPLKKPLHGRIQLSYDTPETIAAYCSDQHTICFDIDELTQENRMRSITRLTPHLKNKTFIYDQRIPNIYWEALAPKYLIINGSVAASALPNLPATILIYQQGTPGLSASKITLSSELDDFPCAPFLLLTQRKSDTKTIMRMKKIVVTNSTLRSDLRNIPRTAVKIFIGNDNRHAAQNMNDGDQLHESIEAYQQALLNVTQSNLASHNSSSALEPSLTPPVRMAREVSDRSDIDTIKSEARSIELCEQTSVLDHLSESNTINLVENTLTTADMMAGNSEATLDARSQRNITPSFNLAANSSDGSTKERDKSRKHYLLSTTINRGNDHQARQSRTTTENNFDEGMPSTLGTITSRNTQLLIKAPTAEQPEASVSFSNSARKKRHVISRDDDKAPSPHQKRRRIQHSTNRQPAAKTQACQTTISVTPSDVYRIHFYPINSTQPVQQNKNSTTPADNAPWKASL